MAAWVLFRTVLCQSTSEYGVLPPNSGPDATPNPNYHHTLQDTFDKISAKSLQIVGDVAVLLVK